MHVFGLPDRAAADMLALIGPISPPGSQSVQLQRIWSGGSHVPDCRVGTHI